MSTRSGTSSGNFIHSNIEGQRFQWEIRGMTEVLHDPGTSFDVTFH